MDDVAAKYGSFELDHGLERCSVRYPELPRRSADRPKRTCASAGCDRWPTFLTRSPFNRSPMNWRPRRAAIASSICSMCWATPRMIDHASAERSQRRRILTCSTPRVMRRVIEIVARAVRLGQEEAGQRPRARHRRAPQLPDLCRDGGRSGGGQRASFAFRASTWRSTPAR